MKEILFREPYRSAIPVEGVRVIGAWFPGQVDLAHGRLNHQLWLVQCRFEEAANLFDLHLGGSLFLTSSAFVLKSLILTAAKVDGLLIMSDASVAGTLEMNGLEVGESLFMRGSDATFKNVSLRSAKVAGNLEMDNATVDGTLDMNSLEVGQHLLMDVNARNDVDLVGAKVAGGVNMNEATVFGTLDMDGLEVGHHLAMDVIILKDMILHGATVAGQLNLDNATVTGRLDMESLEVGQDLLMRGPAALMREPGGERDRDHDDATFKDVNLSRAKVAGQVSLDDATILGTLNMEALEVGQHLLMRKAIIHNAAKLIFAHIGLSVDLSDARLANLVDLSATRIEGGLRLGSDFLPAPEWRDGARLILRNTHAGVVQDYWDHETDAWPDELELDGFTYDRLGGTVAPAPG